MERDEEAQTKGKIRKAAHLLLFKRHRKPGVKTWELKKVLGKNYLEYLSILDEELQRLGLRVKRISEGEGQVERYFVGIGEHPSKTEARSFGWRIDDLAILAASLLHVFSRQGVAPTKDVKNLLREKFPGWRIDYVLDRFIRLGYLDEDDKNILRIGWRTRAEIDQKTLLGLLLGIEEEK